MKAPFGPEPFFSFSVPDPRTRPQAGKGRILLKWEGHMGKGAIPNQKEKKVKQPLGRNLMRNLLVIWIWIRIRIRILVPCTVGVL